MAPQLALAEKDVATLYALYGFRPLPLREKGVLVFEQSIVGRHLAEIVPLDRASSRVERLREDLERSGYSCKIRDNSQLVSDLDNKLFSEFFSLTSTRQRISELYAQFAQKLRQTTGIDYEYKPIRFTTESGPISRRQDLVRQITRVVRQSGPRLIILEAAAGFGKTCTAYEVALELAQYDEPLLPFFSELSRNRTAPAFQYILLDELNRNFPGVNTSLARYQIERGRLVVLLDGFDELLHKPRIKKPVFDDAEPMLETIRELLKGDACVLITTRKATLLSGDEFQEWLDKYSDEFSVFRFLLERPDPRTWLDGEKRRLLHQAEFPIEQLANPVLFLFLESLGEAEFEECCKAPEKLVDEYLNRLLERESDRQDLRMTPIEQKMIFSAIARQMMEDDFKAEQRRYFEEMIRQHFEPLLAEVSLRYPPTYEGKRRPEISELTERLLLHAWFDRRLDSRGLLGFQNDFILGTLAGDNILAEPEEWVGSEEFVDLAITAYSIRPERLREQLWSKLRFMSEFLSPNLTIEYDLALAREVRRDLVSQTYSDFSVNSVGFGENHDIRNCCFVNSRFKACRFDRSRLLNVTFINCNFEDCVAGGESAGTAIYTFDCFSKTPDFLSRLASGHDEELRDQKFRGSSKSRKEPAFVQDVLENFWPPGRPNFSRRRALRTLYLGLGNENRDAVADAIQWLRDNGLVLVESDHADLNLDRLRNIMQLLGRV